MIASRKMLGLAVTEGAITAVEVGVVHGSRKVLRAAEFPMPEGDPAREPVPLGKALRQFLRQNHFSASHCVIGLAAKWLVAKEKTLPPTAADMVVGLLTIATEREFASDPKDLIFDYTGLSSSAQGQSALLVAAPRKNVDHLVATAEAAGLTVAAVTSSTMALAAATAGLVSPGRLVLYLSPNGAELCGQSGGGIRLLRRLPVSAPGAGAAGAALMNGWLENLAGELRRIVTLLPGAETPQQAPHLYVWNAAGIPPGALDTLGERLNLGVRLCEYPSGLEIAEGPPATAGEAPAAAALAAAGLSKPFPAVDFLHSRLSPRTKTALGRKLVWAGGVAAVVILVCVGLLLNWQAQQAEVEDLKRQLDDMRPAVTAAKDVVDKAAFARGWYDRRPRYLGCLRELTLAFPAEGRIWATSLAISEDMRVLLSGKASDGTAVLEVVDRLRGSKSFSQVKHLYTREVGGGVQEVSFAISLTFAKADGP